MYEPRPTFLRSTKEPDHNISNIRPVPPFNWETDDPILSEKDSTKKVEADNNPYAQEIGSTALTAVEIIDAKQNANKTVVNQLQYLDTARPISQN